MIKHMGEFQPLDLVLFEGKGLISRGIQLLTGSRKSHVGILIPDPVDFAEWQVYESTTLSDVPDLATGAAVKGVQRVGLRDRLESYDGNVFWRGIDGPRPPEMMHELAEFQKEYEGRAYEDNQLELLAAAIDAVDLIRHEDAHSVFCSELVALVYRRLGIMPPGQPANEFTPADFSKDFPLNIGYSLRDVKPIN